MLKTFCFILFAFSVILGMTVLPVHANEKDVADPFQSNEAVEYLNLSDSIIANELVSGDELARVYLKRGTHFFQLGRPVMAIQSFKEVRTNTSDPDLIGESDLRTGDIYFEQNSYSRALEFYTSALRLFDKSDNHKARARARFKTATIHHRRGDEDMAESLLLLVVADPYVDDVRRALAHETLGRVYYNLTAFDSCRSHLNQAIELYTRFELEEEQLEIYELLMQSYLDEGNVSKARSVAMDASELAANLNNPEHTIRYLSRVAGFFAASGDYSQAISFQELALTNSAQLPAGQAVMQYQIMGDYFALAGRDADALLAYHEAEHLAKKQGYTTSLEAIHRKKADFFNSRQRYKEAFTSLAAADSLKTANFNAQIEQYKRDLGKDKFREEVYLRTEGDMRTALEEKQLSNMRNAVVIGVIFFSIIIIFLLREFGQKRKLSRILEWKVYKRTRELRKANKELNTYIYKSSHDLRTPLTSIKSLLRLLEKEEHNASTKKYLGLIQACSEQMDDILVNLSRAVDYKKVDVKIEQIDFNKIRYQIQEKELAHLKGIKVVWDIQEAGAFYSDFKLIKVILQQTIANAVAYRKGTPDDYCKVSIYTEPSGARISIADNGLGISDKVRDKVFDMFVKGTHKSTGAGLGLYLVRIAVDKIRAKINLETEENKGCTFTFSLPNLN